ncbi:MULTISPECIES: cation:proton antiporter [unclassified Archaeoglobus]|jgi:CPA2 family monovalent cation:H+ antiporter-2|uniref:cation:proton antiporter domain-containing protein n=1 Tax=unclassified Archaeoglobus TaxID=2643606 RepID=UPI0025BF9D0A|nr:MULTISPECIES: cation:proton antiporter [unclassified Archaeoglobus]
MLPLIVTAAAIAAILSRKLRITPIPAYIFVGIALNQLGLHLAEDIEIIGKLGVVFLVLHWDENKSCYVEGERFEDTAKRFCRLCLQLFPAFLVLLYLGFNIHDSLILASVVYISSSAINLKMLVDNRKLIFAFAEIVILLMVFEAAAFDIYLLYPFLGNLMDREDEIPYLLTFSIPSISLFLVEKAESFRSTGCGAFGISLHRSKFDKF